MKHVITLITIMIVLSFPVIESASIGNQAPFNNYSNPCSTINSTWVQAYDTSYARYIINYWMDYGVLKTYNNSIYMLYPYWLYIGGYKESLILTKYDIANFTRTAHVWIYTGYPGARVEDFVFYDNKIYSILSYSGYDYILIFDHNWNLSTSYMITHNTGDYKKLSIIQNKLTVYDAFNGAIFFFNPSLQLIDAKRFAESSNYLDFGIQQIGSLIFVKYRTYDYSGIIAYDSNLQPLWGYKIGQSGYKVSISENIYIYNDNTIYKILPSGSIAWSKTISLSTYTYIYGIKDYYNTTLIFIRIGNNPAVIILDKDGNIIEGKIVFPDKQYYKISLYLNDEHIHFDIYNGSYIYGITADNGLVLIKDGIKTIQHFMKPLTLYYQISISDTTPSLSSYTRELSPLQASVSVEQASTSSYVIGKDQITIGSNRYDNPLYDNTISHILTPKCVSPIHYTSKPSPKPCGLTCPSYTIVNAFSTLFYNQYFSNIFRNDKNIFLSMPTYKGSVNSTHFRISYDIIKYNTETADAVKTSIEFIVEYYTNPKITADYNNIIIANTHYYYTLLHALDYNYNIIKSIKITHPYMSYHNIYSTIDGYIVHGTSENIILYVDKNLSSYKLYTLNNSNLMIRYANKTRDGYLVIGLLRSGITESDNYIGYYDLNMNLIWGYFDTSISRAYKGYVGNYIYRLDFVNYNTILYKYDYNGSLIYAYKINLNNYSFYPQGVAEFNNKALVYGNIIINDTIRPPAVILINDDGSIGFVKALNHTAISSYMINQYRDEYFSFSVNNETGEYTIVFNTVMRKSLLESYQATLLVNDGIGYSWSDLMFDATNTYIFSTTPYTPSKLIQHQISSTDITQSYSLTEITYSPTISNSTQPYYLVMKTEALSCSPITPTTTTTTTPITTETTTPEETTTTETTTETTIPEETTTTTTTTSQSSIIGLSIFIITSLLVITIISLLTSKKGLV